MGLQAGTLPIGPSRRTLITHVTSVDTDPLGVWAEQVIDYISFPNPDYPDLPDAVFARIELWLEGAAAADRLWVDDVTFSEVTSPGVYGPSLLAEDEATFETGLSDEWQAAGCTIHRTSLDAHTGSYSVRVDPVGGGDAVMSLGRYLPIEPSTEYALRFWTKQTGAAAKAVGQRIYFYQ